MKPSVSINYNSQNRIDVNRTYDNSIMNIHESGYIEDDIPKMVKIKNPLINQSFAAVKSGKNKVKLQPIEKTSALRRKVELYQKNLK